MITFYLFIKIFIFIVFVCVTVPLDNPTGYYRMKFQLPSANWSYPNRKNILCFDGVDNCFYVWLNHQFVGFSKDSRLPAGILYVIIILKIKKNVDTISVDFIFHQVLCNFIKLRYFFNFFII